MANEIIGEFAILVCFPRIVQGMNYYYAWAYGHWVEKITTPFNNSRSVIDLFDVASSHQYILRFNELEELQRFNKYYTDYVTIAQKFTFQHKSLFVIRKY